MEGPAESRAPFAREESGPVPPEPLSIGTGRTGPDSWRSRGERNSAGPSTEPYLCRIPARTWWPAPAASSTPSTS
jgi:hypothetical protein